MNWLLLFIVIALVVGFILPIASRKIVYKKLTVLLQQQKYQEFENVLDGFWCTFSYRPYNREVMRLSAYMLQNDAKKIDTQFDALFKKFKMNDTQRSDVAKRGFYYYLENKKYDQAKKMLAICKEYDNNTNEVDTMEVMSSIIIDKKSEHIRDMKGRLASLKKENDAFSNPAKKVRIGIFEYLIGLQYTYLHNKKESKKYLDAALEHCKDTTYESHIKEIIRENGI